MNEFNEYLAEQGISTDIYDKYPTIPHRYFILLPSDCNDLIREIESEAGTPISRMQCIDGIYKMDGSVKISQLTAYKQGRMLGMDITSFIAVHALGIDLNDHILDLCCAPGTKLVLMRAIQQRQAKSKGLQSIKHGSITGVDVAKHRLYTCNSLLHKCHIAQNVRLFCTDGTEFSIGRPTILDTLFGSDKKRLLKNDGNTDQHNRLFACKLLSQDPQLPIDDSLLYDKVIVDAECTHDGSIVHVLKRTQSADDKFSLNLRDLDQLELLQRRLLERGFKSLKPGGTLVYSTCSFAARQNEGIILWFMQKYGGEAELSKVPGLESIDQSGGETQKSINAYLDKQFYSKFHSETDKRLLIDIKQSTVRFYGDYAKCRVTGEQFWTSGFFVAKITKRLR